MSPEAPPLLASQRQAVILTELARTGGVRVADLTGRLGVSDMTVRRDISDLATRGLLTKVHGGAVVNRSSHEPGFAAKSALHIDAKTAIAQAAAALIVPGDAVALSAGTTTFEVARALRDIENLTVVTNSLPVADLFAAPAPSVGHRHDAGPDLFAGHHHEIPVILTGGIRTPSAALVGPVAVASLAGLHTDWLFLGVHGLDARAGLTTPNLWEADTSRALIAGAARVVVVADSSKWGVVGLSTIAPLNCVDILITDDGLPDAAREFLAERVGELKLVPA